VEVAQSDSGAPAAPATEDRRPLLRRAGERAAYLALRGLWSLLGAMPVADARRFLEAVAALFARLDRRHRRVVEENLESAFPGMDPVVRDSVVAASFLNWGRLAAEVIHVDELIEESRRRKEWKALSLAVKEGLEGGRGLLVLTAHTANFELLARLFGTVIRPVSVFHRPLGIAEVDGFLIRERERCGVRTLGRGVAVRESLRILAAGGCVAVPLDQNQREGHGIFVDVLGRPACTSTVLARLSLSSGAPVLPVFAVWNGQGTTPFIGDLVPAPARRPSPSGREAVIRDLTVRYSAEIDRVVRRFPHQWNWAHRRWKTRPPAGAAPASDATARR
jgi:KDO2-lipid IV(A) lauroyltransferase